MAVAPAPPRLEIITRRSWLPDSLRYRIEAYSPQTEFGRIVKLCLKELPDPHMAAELLDGISRIVVVESALSMVKIHGDGDLLCRHEWPRCRHLRENFGVVSRRVVTTAGVNYLVDCLQNLQEPENFKYHGIGTGTTAEAIGDTALVTELTTEYNPNSTRATGSLTEGASANIFRTVGTNTLDSGTPAITEHMLFTQAATGGGTGLDRSVFSAINLTGTNGDGLQSTLDETLAAGG
jgi:hypothetical protein